MRSPNLRKGFAIGGKKIQCMFKKEESVQLFCVVLCWEFADQHFPFDIEAYKQSSCALVTLFLKIVQVLFALYSSEYIPGLYMHSHCTCIDQRECMYCQQEDIYFNSQKE